MRFPSASPPSRTEGKDVTILTIGATLYTRHGRRRRPCDEKYGISAEVIDARSRRSLQLREGHRVRQEDRPHHAGLLTPVTRGNILNDMATQHHPAGLRLSRCASRGGRVAKNWITPAAEYKEQFYPQPEWIIDAHA